MDAGGLRGAGGHSVWVAVIGHFLRGAFGELFVMTGAGIDVSPEDNPTSEPEPDAIALDRDVRNFAERNPRAEDLRLVVEVADSSLAFDLSTKAGLYARAGIADYWVLDVVARRVIVHRGPALGRYESVVVYGENESVAPLSAPAEEFRMSGGVNRRECVRIRTFTET